MPRLIKPLIITLLSISLFSCANNSSDSSSIETTPSSINEELAITPISSIYPGEQIQLEAKKGNKKVDASFELINPSKTSTLTSDGLFYAGTTPGTYQIKASFESEVSNIEVVVDTPILDDEVLNIPVSYKASLKLEGSLAGSLAVKEVSVEFVKDKGMFISLGDGGVYIEDGVCYNYLVEDNKATFTYETDKDKEATPEAINATFDLKGAINSSRYEYLTYLKSSNEFIFQMNKEAANNTVAEYGLFFYMGLLQMEVNAAVIGINPADFTFTNLYGVKEGKLYNLNLTPIEKLSVEPIVGVHSSKTA